MPFDEHFVREKAGGLRLVRRMMRALPSNPRCKLCLAPFKGPGGRVVRMAGFSPSRKNPNYCSACFETGPNGGEELSIGVLFADIRGYTTLSETRPPEEVRALLARFYEAATKVLVSTDAIIDKLYGDEVIALFLPFIIKEEQVVTRLVSAAEGLLRAVGYGSAEGAWCALGVGLDTGTAYVGNVGAGDVKDFTAIGDVVNTASRLQGVAQAGEIVMSSRVYQHVRSFHPHAKPASFELKGKALPEEAYVISLDRPLVRA
jgi:adenylate cyclase